MTMDASSWRKSSYSGNANNCVETAPTSGDAVAVRDSKNPHDAVLLVSATAWNGLLASLRS